eukprot:TRINITY_DN13133_c1_g1_i1.p1 TRINITY_DN13133_c1_g1~~TRINITY_DN13133_c1_g1_i1.p1  ORF type:complete len:123 (+),score=1.09 TRINITY_DN13133_c1_g1_i1:366-734(+)
MILEVEVGDSANRIHCLCTHRSFLLKFEQSLFTDPTGVITSIDDGFLREEAGVCRVQRPERGFFHRRRVSKNFGLRGMTEVSSIGSDFLTHCENLEPIDLGGNPGAYKCFKAKLPAGKFNDE